MVAFFFTHTFPTRERTMADEVATQTTETETAADTAAVETDWKAEAEKWKGLSRKHEGTAKANADAAQRLTQIEEAQKTEAQKAADKATESEARATRAELEAARLRVAVSKGLTLTQAKRLIGTTDDELAADADELLASFTRTEVAEEKGDTLLTRPKEALKSGSTVSRVGEVSSDPQQRARDYYANAKTK